MGILLSPGGEGGEEWVGITMSVDTETSVIEISENTIIIRIMNIWQKEGG